MTLAACKKDKESQGEAVFTASIEHQGGKTSLDPNSGYIHWTAGDQIVIGNDDGESAVFTLQSGEGTSEGSFGTSGEFSTVGPFIAAYPSDAMIENGTVTFNLPATQTIGETGTFGNGANPLVACSDDKNLSFKNLCGGLGIRLKGVGAHVSAVRITSKNTSEKLWGAYEVSNCAANEPALTVASNNQGTNVITLNCDVTLTTAAKTFFVMLPPGTLTNGFTMEVLDGDQVLATKETTSDIALVVRNNVTCFNEILIDVEFDGHVTIPTGMNASDIIVTNFLEDAVPDENGDFFIGYSKTMMAKNATNGKLVYISINSKDDNIKSSTENDYELNAKETAITIAMQMLPMVLGSCSDEMLHAVKDILYSLQPVKALETAIQNTVNTHGYLKLDELETALVSLRSFIDSEFEIVRESPETNAPQGILVGEGGQRQETINPPYFYPNMMHGTMFKVDNYQHFTSPEYWRIRCTGYNGLAACFGVVPGYVDIEHPNPDGSYTLTYDDEKPLYYLPPASLGRVLNIMTFGDWDGLKQLIKDIGNKFTDPNYEPLFDKADLENMYFNINQGTNVLALLAITEDYRIYIANVLYWVFDAVSATVAINGEFMQSLITNFINDADYVSTFLTEIQNGEEGFTTLIDVTAQKFFEFASSGLIQASVESLAQKAGDIAAAISGIGTAAHVCDFVLKFVTWVRIDSFGLPIVAEFNNSFSLPGLITNSYEVLSSTQATVTGALINEGTHGIMERGICYSTSPNPTPSHHYVVAQGTGLGAFTCTLQNLLPYTDYYARSYAKNNLGDIGYGNEVSFKTYAAVPLLTTYPVNESDITSTSAVFSGKVEGVASNTIVTRGFLYSTSPQVVINQPGVMAVNAPEGGTGEFTATATGLNANTTYYYKAYIVTDENEPFHGPEKWFTTLPGGSQTFTITATANPSNGGTVTGGGTYNQGQSCTVTATANSGYTFSNWTENGNAVSTNANYTFTVNSDRTLAANFTANGGGGGGGDHEYVDLGLPSGLLWATCNVGADAPEEYGDYFAWGEITPKDDYSWSTYQYCNGSYNTLTKYCNNANYGYNGFTDGLTTLLPEDDAATANWGNDWRMPTWEEWWELLDNTTATMTTQNGVYGRLFIASNGNSLFLPAADFLSEGHTLFSYDRGWYLSTAAVNPFYAGWYYFGSNNSSMGWGNSGRAQGSSVRPVRSAY